MKMKNAWDFPIKGAQNEFLLVNRPGILSKSRLRIFNQRFSLQGREARLRAEKRQHGCRTPNSQIPNPDSLPCQHASRNGQIAPESRAYPFG
jgi:hypothetical protein